MADSLHNGDIFGATASAPKQAVAEPGSGAPKPDSALNKSGTGSNDALASWASSASIPSTDLSSEKLLLPASRIMLQNRNFPSLGGIPLLAKLGQGGMGAVYFGIHPRLRQEVAVKVLPFLLAEQQPELIQRFFREAQSAARVHSQHLVTVLDVNEEGGLFFLVMEFVNGVSAGGFLKGLKADGKIGCDEATALDICIAATEGLAAAHAESIIHRDIKPDNIMVPKSKNGLLLVKKAKLADLGLARCDEGGQSLTGSQSMMGTPGYMAPEQAEDAKNAQKPADVFSMGATLYALLCGTPPFTGSTPMQAILAAIQKPHVPVLQLRPDISAATSAVIEECLLKDPARRMPDADALLERLVDCRKNVSGPSQVAMPGSRAGTGNEAPVSSTVAPASASITAAIQAARAASHAPDPRRHESLPVQAAPVRPVPEPVQTAAKSRAMPLAAAALVAVLAAGAGFWAWREHMNGVIRGEIESTVKAAQPGRMAYSQTLATAISSLEDLKNKYAARPGDELKPASALLLELAARRDALDKRQALFDSQMAEARRLIASDPQRGLMRLDRAEETGQANAAEYYPALTTGIFALREEARAALQATKLEFQQGVEAGRAAAARGDWEAAQATWVKALAKLGDAEHPMKDEAKAQLKLASAELQKHLDFGIKLKQADDALVAQQFEQAKQMYEVAKPLWPDSPDMAKLDAGMHAAQKGIESNKYSAALAAGRKSLNEKHWAEAESSFNDALKFRENDSAALQGLNDVKAQAREERISMSVLEGREALDKKNWSGAEAAFNRVLSDKPGETSAIAGLAAAKLGVEEAKAVAARAEAAAAEAARVARFQSAMEIGRNAAKDKHWVEAQKSFADALREFPDSKDARYELAMASGHVFAETKNWAEAERYFIEACNLRPEDQTAAAVALSDVRASRARSTYVPGRSDDGSNGRNADRAINALNAVNHIFGR